MGEGVNNLRQIVASFRADLGHTPFVPVQLIVGGQRHTCYLKLEWFNPTGSIKARTAYGLLNSLVSQDRLHPNSILVESTSGNLGVALAHYASRLRIGFVAIVDRNVSTYNASRMKSFGATVEMVSHQDKAGGYLLARLARVREIMEKDKKGSVVWPDQYANNANPQVHYEITGPEIAEQARSGVDAVFVAVSTGGTLAGISRYLRDVYPDVKIIAVDVQGSVAIGGEPGPRQLTGIGASKKSAFLTPGCYDDHVFVTDREAFSACRMVDADIGLRVGGSSGAVIAATSRYLLRYPHLERVICVLPDSGIPYHTTIYSNRWLRRKNCEPSRSLLALDKVTYESMPSILNRRNHG
jgi:cysteine synthase A